MIKVYSAENSMDVGLIRGILEEDGINCLVKNQNLSGAMGEIPPLECWPELWITNDYDLIRAQNIVKSALLPTINNTVPWHCACGEKIEGQFTACWKCGEERAN